MNDTAMTAKAFLESIESQQKRVQMMHEEYQRIRQSLDVSGVNYECTGAVNATRKTDAMAEMIAEMVDFESEMKQEECVLASMHLKATSSISRLTDDKEREVLHRWYLLHQSEDEIRKAMGYSQSMIYSFRQRGLSHLENFGKNRKNSE